MPTTAKVRFTVLQSGEIDVLIRDSTLTFSRDVQLGLSEDAITLYAGQAFMVRKSLGVGSLKDLTGATICMLTGATLELNLADYNKRNGIDDPLAAVRQGGRGVRRRRDRAAATATATIRAPWRPRARP